MVDLEREVPIITSEKELKQYIQPLFVIEDYWGSNKDYKRFKTQIRNVVRAAFGIEKLREYPIKFKFYKDDKKTHTLELRRFLYNIYCWYPFVEVQDIRFVDESFILLPEQIPEINNWIFDKIAKILYDEGVSGSKVNKYMAAVTSSLCSISIDFSTIMGLHYDETTFHEMYDDEEYRSMIDLTFDDNSNIQPIEMEEKLNKVEKALVEKLKADKNNPIGVMLRAGTGLKTKQLIEFFVMVGLRPTLDGEVITTPINNSFLIKGLDRPSYMYIDALGARKPLLANNKEMGKVGYFCKTLNIAVRTLEVSAKTYNCGTDHYVNYDIKTSAHLRRMRGKYYYDEELEDYKVIDESDLELVGKTLKVRSIVTCCCGENHVCPTCVGLSINHNWDIRKGYSVFITEEYSKDIEQNVLSTKHLLVTKSERIEFSDTFHKWFILDGEEIKILDGIKDAKDLLIWVDPEEVQRVEEFDEDTTYNTFIETGRFQIINKKTGEATGVSIKNGKTIYICTNTSEMMDKDGYIKLSDFEEDTPIFEISIENNELTKPFYDLMSILDSEKRKDMDEVTIDAISNRFLDILVEGKLDVPIAAAEFILNRLCRRPDDVRRRPNFGKHKIPPYKFYGVKKVNEENASPTIGLIFEQLERQISRLDMDERNDTSYIDAFFKEDISTEPFMKHRRIIEREKELGIYEEDY